MHKWCSTIHEFTLESDFKDILVGRYLAPFVSTSVLDSRWPTQNELSGIGGFFFYVTGLLLI